MSKVPKHLIEEAKRRGIVPGALVACVADDSDTKIVPPLKEWSMSQGEVRIGPGQSILSVYIYSPHCPRQWATVITPAPTKTPAKLHKRQLFDLVQDNLLHHFETEDLELTEAIQRATTFKQLLRAINKYSEDDPDMLYDIIDILVETLDDIERQ